MCRNPKPHTFLPLFWLRFSWDFELGTFGITSKSYTPMSFSLTHNCYLTCQFLKKCPPAHLFPSCSQQDILLQNPSAVFLKLIKSKVSEVWDPAKNTLQCSSDSQSKVGICGCDKSSGKPCGPHLLLWLRATAVVFPLSLFGFRGLK